MSQTKSDLTRRNLKLALLRIENNRPLIICKKRKLSILAVAEEAGMSSSSVHNNYPDIAESIRVKINKDSRAQRNSKHQELKNEIAKNKELRAKIIELSSQMRHIASENAKILIENQKLSSIINCDNISIIKK